MALLSAPGAVLLRLLAAALVLLARAAPAQKATDYQVEAAFLFHFTQFVEWPQPDGAPQDRPLTLCILGQDPFGSYLDELVRDERVGQRPLAVLRLQEPEQSEPCSVLFIAASESARLDLVLTALSGRSVLSVSDMEGFVRRGGMVGFVLRDGRVRLRIDAKRASEAGLTLSSKLLRVAELVTHRGDRR